MSTPRIFHIDISRYERLRAQGWKMEADSKSPTPYRDGDSVYHLIRGERDFCGDCQQEVESLKAETPAELNDEKIALYGLTRMD